MGFITRGTTEVGPSSHPQGWINLEPFLISNKLIEIITINFFNVPASYRHNCPGNLCKKEIMGFINNGNHNVLFIFYSRFLKKSGSL